MKLRNIFIVSTSWLILICGILLINFMPSVIPVPLKKSFIYFPFEIGEWEAKEKKGPDYFLATLGADDAVLREYTNKDGDKIELYMAYFNYVKEGRTPHAPQLCWVGAGWSFKDLGCESYRSNIDRDSWVSAKKILARKEEKDILLFYCYKIGNKYVVDLAEFRILAACGSILKRKSNAFTLQLTSETDSENFLAKEKLMDEFLSKALSILDADFLP